MQIDWLTLTAQIANFLVLIWLLQKFLYAPITNAMARREERIEERLIDARKAREEAEAEAKALRDQQQALEDSKADILDDARKGAGDLRKGLEEEVREDVRQMHRTWQQHLEDEHAELAQTLQRRVAGQVLGVVRQILSEFADTDLEGQIADVFIRRLEAISEDDLDRLTESAKRGQDQALVESGLELPPAIRSRITRAIHEKLEDGVDVQYRTDPDILLGIRMILSDLTVEWSAARHLDRLQANIDESLEAAAGKPAEAARK